MAIAVALGERLDTFTLTRPSALILYGAEEQRDLYRTR
jgi:hypothetical protein